MIGLDTNVLVRFFAQDEPQQSKAARALINEKLTRDRPGYVAAIVLAEFAWVMKRLYAADRDEVAAAIEGLLTSPVMAVEYKPLIWKALGDFRSTSIGFSDCLIKHINAAAGCEATCTFDRSAAKIAGFRLLA